VISPVIRDIAHIAKKEADTKTILVMDDDECMRGLLRLHLSNPGYEVLVAEDVVDAGHGRP
jgi:CheY-like chemotaxis protein